jgi:hypothetical protein
MRHLKPAQRHPGFHRRRLFPRRSTGSRRQWLSQYIAAIGECCVRLEGIPRPAEVRPISPDDAKAYFDAFMPRVRRDASGNIAV